MDRQSRNYIWDSFWAEHARSKSWFHHLLWRIRFFFSRTYANKIFQYLGKPAKASCLEVGCGSACTLHYLNRLIPVGRCIALDLSPIAIKIVRQISPDFRTGVANAFELPLASGTFDASFSIGLIEHFNREKAEQIVKEKIRVTCPGGTVGIAVPWKSSIYNMVVRKVFGPLWPFGSENPFHRKELFQFMEKMALKDIEIHVVYGSVLLGVGRKIQ
jgi:SAM-dependent methyltransferase